MRKRSESVSLEAAGPAFDPAMTPEEREDQLISLAVSLAEQQLINGTASAQVITHYLRLGSTKERLEKEKLRQENDLIRAKTKSLESSRRIEDLYKGALDAMRTYSGLDGEAYDA